MPKILLFLFFLGTYAFWLWISPKSSAKMQTDLIAGRSFWSSELVLLEGMALFFGSIYLLSGLWSLKLFLLVLIAAQLGSLVAWVLNSILGAGSEESSARVLWAGGEFGLKHPFVLGIPGLLSILFALAYPVVGGVVLFKHPWGSSELEALVLKYTLLFLISSGYMLTTIVNVSVLASEDLDDDTRQRIFISQFIGLIQSAIFVALAFWAFHPGGQPLPIGLFGIPTGTFSLQTLLLMLALLAATVLIPYLAGTQKARRKKLRVLGKIRDYLADIEDILEAPTGDLYIARLTEVRDRVAGASGQFTDSDKLLGFARDMSKDSEGASAELKRMAAAIEKARDLDLRFKFLDDLAKLEKGLDDAIADLGKRSPDKIEDEARHWGETYKGRKEELSKTIEAAASRKPLITAGVGTLAGAVVLDVVSEVAQTGWQWFTHAQK
jgi:hypothetical protein